MALVAGAAWLARPAVADTDNSTLSIQATVASACALSSGTINFGTYLAGAASHRDYGGAIGYVRCYNMALTIELDSGQNASGSTRHMKSGSSLLRYELFQDINRTRIFSTGANALALTSDATGAASVQVYGRIFSGQVVPPGSYTDTVGIVLTF
jgi:spore coat protein U-like protein